MKIPLQGLLQRNHSPIELDVRSRDKIQQFDSSQQQICITMCDVHYPVGSRENEICKERCRQE